MGTRSLVLVAGSGRSGTSLMGLLLKALGCVIPQPEVPADETNPLGFAEPQWVVDLHTRLLGRVQVQTADARPAAWGAALKVQHDTQVASRIAQWLQPQFAGGDVVVVKDPRSLWFVPLWRTAAERVGADLKMITMLRHPAEVVASKEQHYGRAKSTEAQRLGGWINTMLYLERATRDVPRAYVQYEDLLEDWVVQVDRIADALSLEQLRRAPARAQAQASALVDPTLRRASAEWGQFELPKAAVDLASTTWEGLLQLAVAGPEGDASATERLDAAREAYGQLYGEAEALAYSSVLAAMRQGQQKAEQAAARKIDAAEKAARKAVQTALEQAGPRPGPGPVAQATWQAVRRYYPSVPPSVRAAVPVSVRTALKRRLT